MELLEVRTETREGWLESWIGLIRRRWPIGLAVFATLMGLVVLVVFTAVPVYRAQARLRLGEPPPMSGVSPTAGFFGLMRIGGDPFANDMELLESRSLAEGVIADVSLNAGLEAKRGLHRDTVFASFAADASTDRATFEFAWLDGGAVAIRMIAPVDSTIGSVAVGDVARFGGVTAAFRPWRDGMPRTITLRTVPPSLAVLEQQPRMIVERSRRDANVVDVQYDATDPRVAEHVVGSIIDRFVALRAAIQRRESGQTVDSLRVVADSTGRELLAAEAALEEWSRETRLMQPDIQAEAFMERYGLLAAQVEEARYEMEAIVGLADRIDASPDTVLDWVLILTHPKFLENETIGTLLTQLAQLQRQRSEMLVRRAPTSREVQLIDEQLRGLDTTLRSLVHGYRDALGRRLDVLEEQAAGMDRALAATPAQAVELARRQRAIRLLSEIIILTEQRLRQEELRQALTFSNVQVIDPPALRYKPVWPRKKLGLAVGLLISGAFGLLALVVAERADRTVRRSREIEELTGAPILAVTVADRAHSPSLSDGEYRAIARYARPDANGATRMSLVAPGRDERAVALVQALATGNGQLKALPAGTQTRGTELIALPAVDDFATALAADGGPVVLVVRYGRTRRDALARAIRLLREAGSRVAGTIVVCERERQRSGLQA